MFYPEFFEYRLNHEITLRKITHLGGSANQRLKFAKDIRVEATFAAQGRKLGVNPGNRVVDAILAHIANDDRDLEASQQLESELASHEPRTDNANTGNRFRERFVRGTGGALATFLNQHERINAGAELISRNQLGEHVVFSGEPARLGTRTSRGHEIESGVGGLSDRSDFCLQHFPRRVDRNRPNRRTLNRTRLVFAGDFSSSR